MWYNIITKTKHERHSRYRKVKKMEKERMNKCVRAINRIKKGNRNVAIKAMEGNNPNRDIIYILANSKFDSNGYNELLDKSTVFDLLAKFAKEAEKVIDKHFTIDYCQPVRYIDGFDFGFMYDISER